MEKTSYAKSPANFLRAALFLSLVAVAIFAAWSFLSQRIYNLELAMPTIEVDPGLGEFEEGRASWFDVPYIANPTYATPQAVKDASSPTLFLDMMPPRRAHSYIPTGAGPAPVVILFHGAGRDGFSMLDMWLETAQTHGIALIAPKSMGASWPRNTPNPYFVNRLIEDLATKTQIDRNRIYLFGHSDGAGYAQLLLNRTTGPWKAAALHGGLANWDALRPPQVAKPYRVYVGDREHTFDLATGRRHGDGLAQYGHRSEMLVIPRHNHWFYEIGPQVAEDSWAWFQTL